MPGFGTSDRTYTNAMQLMHQLGITVREISIKQACLQHFKDIDHNPETHDTTYENGQARERTQILMDYANKVNGMVIGTGDLSELALGWATYNGDHMSMYGVNASIPKTLIRYLVGHVANNSIDELIGPKGKGQKNMRDFFLYHFLRFGFRPSKLFMLARHAFSVETYDDDVIKHWLRTFIRRFFQQQFKRSCLPDGPKVGSVSLSPRGDWRMPTDAASALWLAECDTL